MNDVAAAAAASAGFHRFVVVNSELIDTSPSVETECGLLTVLTTTKPWQISIICSDIHIHIIVVIVIDIAAKNIAELVIFTTAMICRGNAE